MSRAFFIIFLIYEAPAEPLLAPAISISCREVCKFFGILFYVCSLKILFKMFWIHFLNSKDFKNFHFPGNLFLIKKFFHLNSKCFKELWNFLFFPVFWILSFDWFEMILYERLKMPKNRDLIDFRSFFATTWWFCFPSSKQIWLRDGNKTRLKKTSQEIATSLIMIREMIQTR